MRAKAVYERLVLNIKPKVVDRALKILKKLYQKSKFKAKKGEAEFSSALYVSCLIDKIPIHFKEIL